MANMAVRMAIPAAALMLSATVGLHGGGVSASTWSGSDLAADCNDDRVVAVRTELHVDGGGAEIDDGCVVVLGKGATLILDGVSIWGPEHLVIVGAVREATVVVSDSSIEIGGQLELNPSCCAGDQLVDESHGHVLVTHSSLRAHGIDIQPSFGSPGGSVMIEDSLLSVVDSIQVRPSYLGPAALHGKLHVVDSVFEADHAIDLRTGTSGSTTVTGSQMLGWATMTVTTGPGGSCVVGGNVPALVCT